MTGEDNNVQRQEQPPVQGVAVAAPDSRAAELQAMLDGVQHGLCMFDADGRITAFNTRYVELMALPASDLMGMSMPDLFSIRKAAGKFDHDPGEVFAMVRRNAASGNVMAHAVEGCDGRALRVTNRPLPGGGWVATIEDMTELKSFEAERERQRQFLDDVLDNVPVMVVVKDPVDRRFLHANVAAESFWGFSRTEAIGKSVKELFPALDTAVVDQLDTEALASGVDSTHEAHTTMMPLNGRQVTTRRHAVRGPDNKPRYLVSVVEDVTERVRLEQELSRDRTFLNQIIENVPITIVVKDARTLRYVLVNQAATDHLGIRREAIVGKTAHEVFRKEHADIIEQHDAELLRSGGSMSFNDYGVTTPGGRERIIAVKKLIVRDSAGEPQFVVGVIEDVTDRKQSEERIARLAHYDALTGLPNRVYFREQLDQALKRVRRGEKLAVLFLDLDKFKEVNDTLGHQGGDELLKTVAGRLKSCVRESDIVARLGGDEFAIVQTDVPDATAVIELAERIHGVLRQFCELAGNRFSMDASIGIAMAPQDGTEADQLLKNADLAMYGAKADGRATYRFFEADMDAAMKARRALEFDLRQAIMCGEFELHYQPLVNIRERRIAGCEALMRWRHPKRGMVSPTEFIPVAEDAGIVNQLGEWALRVACLEAAQWRDDIIVTVNVSSVQFKNDSLVQIVMDALAESGLSPRRLELEITESLLLHDNEITMRVLNQLKKLGVRISMDDFGTGYSSLNYLRRFPFDKVKIDKSFIEHIADDASSLAIVQAVISIAKSRDIATTAEGVETQEQLELLRALGCTEMQGYLFSMPKPAAELASMLLTQQPQELARSVA
jgi:diguanylate cyclase (GGDEF)-like protein/PAS domain S-box-containing protein